MNQQTIVLAYSGGLDTSVLLKRFILEGHRVIALTADLGESDATAGEGAARALQAVRAKALALGAADAVLIDAKERFIREFAFPALRANALYEDVYPLSAALSRPLIAQLLVQTAQLHGATAVAHGCTGKGNDQVRIELGVRALNPLLECKAPLREQPLSRPDAIAFAAQHGVPIPHTAEKPYSIDANLWGRSIEAGILENPWNAPPQDAYAWTAPAGKRPAEPETIVISFQAGTPACEDLQGWPLVAYLNRVAGRHGVGRIDLVEDRVVGLKSREVYECPGSSVLILAHRALERLVLTRDELRFKASCDRRYAELVYDGLWNSPLRTALDAFNAVSAQRVSGEVRIQLHNATATVTGIRSGFALYSEQLATYGKDDAFDHQAAAGFIKLHGLALETLALRPPVAAAVTIS
ncbi:MAG TPA: argininosuccinate synthase [Candidatus Baltobacteraceae bacterium]|jgi:argininosuccinate synthase|nr:argininosuccinate synthase [Candidatus Baltobacteraceae bacterium]